MKIAGSRVLITGSSRGIGAELARGFHAAGAQVALVARGADSLALLPIGSMGGHIPLI